MKKLTTKQSTCDYNDFPKDEIVPLCIEATPTSPFINNTLINQRIDEKINGLTFCFPQPVKFFHSARPILALIPPCEKSSIGILSHVLQCGSCGPNIDFV